MYHFYLVSFFTTFLPSNSSQRFIVLSTEFTKFHYPCLRIMLCYLLTLPTVQRLVKRRFYHREQDSILLPESGLGRGEGFDHIARWNVSGVCCKVCLSSNLHKILLFLLSIWTNLSAAHSILEAWIINFGCFTLFSSTDVNNHFDTLMGFFTLYRKSALALASLHNIRFASLYKWRS